MAYNRITKKYGLGIGYRFVLAIFSVAMVILLACFFIAGKVPEIVLTLIAVFGGIFVSFSLGAFFSITYTVPTNLAQREMTLRGNNVSSMYFAVQGLFEGLAAGIATGPILTALKHYDIIYLLPVVAIICCLIAFIMSFFFPEEIGYMSRDVDSGAKAE